MKANSRARSSRIYVWLILFSCICVYLVFARFSFHKPVVAGEVGWMTSCTNLGFLEVPHGYRDFAGPKFRLLYTHPVALIFRLFGVSGESARLLGILSVLMTLILIYGIANEVFKEHRNRRAVGLIACLLYAVHPMVIQGSLILGEDNTILTPMVYLFFLCFLRGRKSRKILRVVFLGLLLNLVLWVKPTPLPFLFFTAATFYMVEKGLRRGIYEVSLTFGLGMALYLLLWWIYSESKYLPFLLPFSNMIGHISYQHLSGTLFNKVYDLTLGAVRLMIWVSPFLISLCVIATGERIIMFWKERKLFLIDLLFIYLWSVFAGHLLVGGIIFGFPRYHFPMLPALSIVASSIILNIISKVKRKHIIMYAILIFTLVIYNVILVGDLTYSVNFMLKESLIEDHISTLKALTTFMFQIFLYVIPLLIIFLVAKIISKELKRRGVILLSLLICTVAGNFSINIMQCMARYNTGYEYGGGGYQETFEFLAEKLMPNDIIIANETIVYNFNRLTNGHSPYFTPSDYQDKKSLIQTIESKKPDAIVYGITLNTAKHLREVFYNKDIQTLLERDFKKTIIGSNIIWLRYHNVIN